MASDNNTLVGVFSDCSAATGAELSSLRDQSFEMAGSVEEPVIQKRARVKEEVVFGKERAEILRADAEGRAIESDTGPQRRVARRRS